MSVVIAPNGVIYPIFSGGNATNQLVKNGGVVLSLNLSIAGGSEVQVSPEPIFAETVILTSSANNSAVLYVGQQGNEQYVLSPGMSLTLRKVKLNTLYILNQSTYTDTVYVIWS
ncbi:MAG: hypothetical protein QW478_07190 [Candidatus Micrarchaeaceae archaeon]